MASNFPGPYAVEMVYTVGGLTHRMLLNCDVSGSPAPGTDVSLISVLDADGTLINLDDAVTSFVALLAPLYDGASDFVEYILWEYTPGTFDRDYISGNSLGTAGSNVGSYAPAKYRKFSFRTAGGGIAYVTLLESIVDGNTQQSYPYTSPASNAIADFVTGTGTNSGWILGRDNTYPVSSLRLSDGQNEAVFRKRFRNT